MDAELTPQTKVQILLAEYSSLRSEIIQRLGNQLQLLAVAAALFVWILGHDLDRRGWIAAMILVLIVTVFGFFLHRDIRRAATRVAQLESELNSRAGETLLVWESAWGSTARGLLGQPIRTTKSSQTATT